MNFIWFLVVGLVTAYSSVTDLPDYNGQLQACTSSDVQAACDGDFQQHQASSQFPTANIWVESVEWAYDNNYIVTIRYQSAVAMDLAILTRLQIVGLQTPSSYLSYKVLYDSSAPSDQLIDDPSDWGFTYMTSTQLSGALVCQQNFEIEYTWCQAGETNADGCSTWTEQYGQHEVYQGGCPATLDFPKFCWKQECEAASSSAQSSSSSATSVSSTVSSSVSSSVSNSVSSSVSSSVSGSVSSSVSSSVSGSVSSSGTTSGSASGSTEAFSSFMSTSSASPSTSSSFDFLSSISTSVSGSVSTSVSSSGSSDTLSSSASPSLVFPSTSSTVSSDFSSIISTSAFPSTELSYSSDAFSSTTPTSMASALPEPCPSAESWCAASLSTISSVSSGCTKCTELPTSLVSTRDPSETDSGEVVTTTDSAGHLTTFTTDTVSVCPECTKSAKLSSTTYSDVSVSSEPGDTFWTTDSSGHLIPHTTIKPSNTLTFTSATVVTITSCDGDQCSEILVTTELATVIPSSTIPGSGVNPTSTTGSEISPDAATNSNSDSRPGSILGSVLGSSQTASVDKSSIPTVAAQSTSVAEGAGSVLSPMSFLASLIFLGMLP